MSGDKEKLESAKWILERNLHWIGAAEMKTGVIVALTTAMLGTLAADFSATMTADRTAWAYLFTIMSLVCLGSAVFCAAMSVLPRTTGPMNSFIFFGRVADQTVADYGDAFRKATETDLLNDCLAQIHRNAEIACNKFQWVRASMMWSFIAIFPWVAALVHLVKR